MTIVNIVMGENTTQHCRLSCFKTQTLQATLRTQKSTSGGVLCMFGRTIVPVSWMCKKQTSGSHTSTESEIISLDAGLRMDGFPALDPWDIVIEDNIQPGHTRTGKVGQIQPNHTSSRKLEGAQLDNLWFQKQDPTCQLRTRGWSIERGGSCTHQHTFFSRRISVVHLWRQRIRDQDDN